MFREDIKFHVVNETFPIRTNGILGNEFLASRNESVCIPSRSSKILYCHILNLDISEGYLPRFELPAGIFAGEVLVKNNYGKGYFKVCNTTPEVFWFEIPRVELIEFKEHTLPSSGFNANIPASETNDPDSSDILASIHKIFTDPNKEENITFETRQIQTDDDDSDYDIFKNVTNDPVNQAGNINNSSDSLHNLPEAMEEDDNSDEGSTNEYNTIYSPRPAITEPNTQLLTSNVGINRDPFNLRHDNLVVFTDLEGKPCDTGIIPVKEHSFNLVEYEIFVEALSSLLSVTQELGLSSVSIAKTNNFDNIPWLKIQKKICQTFATEYCKAVARQNLIGAKVKSKIYYDRNSKSQNLTVGQNIYLLKQPTSKLGDQYAGPYQILEVLPKNNLKISYKNRTRIVHRDKVKIARNISQLDLRLRFLYFYYFLKHNMHYCCLISSQAKCVTRL
ncbi:hypothetical protein M0802_016598 [Mischocyttarus mexicanus]|nr:hypothetical protein M0802_016598 [Mischocyttarus mexicanus]